MQAHLNLNREIKNELEYRRVHSPSYYPHFHSHIEIYVILSGEVEVIVNGRRKLLHGGEISIAMSYDTHGYSTPRSAEAEYLIIPTSYCADILPLIDSRHPTSPFINDPEIFEVVRNAMEHILAEEDEISQRGYVYVILGTILKRTAPEETPTECDAHIPPDMLIYIGEHFRDGLSLPALAKHFGYNASYLSRSFHQTFGISFGRYLILLRLRETVMLMRKGNKTITECAFEGGFRSIRSFYRSFSEEFGCTPKEYLERL